MFKSLCKVSLLFANMQFSLYNSRSLSVRIQRKYTFAHLSSSLTSLRKFEKHIFLKVSPLATICTKRCRCLTSHNLRRKGLRELQQNPFIPEKQNKSQVPRFEASLDVCATDLNC